MNDNANIKARAKIMQYFKPRIEQKKVYFLHLVTVVSEEKRNREKFSNLLYSGIILIPDWIIESITPQGDIVRTTLPKLCSGFF